MSELTNDSIGVLDLNLLKGYLSVLVELIPLVTRILQEKREEISENNVPIKNFGKDKRLTAGRLWKSGGCLLGDEVLFCTFCTRC